MAWWRTETGNGRTRAAAVAELVAALAAYEQAAEIGAGPPPRTGYRTPPAPPRDDAYVDRLAVVAYDLVLAIVTSRGADVPARLPDGPATVHDIAGRAAAQLILTTYEVDPRPVADAAIDNALPHAGPFAGELAGLPRLRKA
ncbi:MAG TPA: hypothetical protein VNA20_18930 [Frankiaceae bacterium]|nr:hypothetical protein [Frankiaceae bacterium]